MEPLNATEIRDYSLVGKESKLAIEKGLADATWYTSPIPRDEMRKLLERKNGPAIKDTLIWFSLIFASGFSVYYWWGNWWIIFPYMVYAVLYASSSDSRWHESSHGTAFKTDWMNNVLYEISSFMVFREAVAWRWSHTRHHSDTIIRGRDPEIAVQRPVDLPRFILQFFTFKSTPREFQKMLKHAFGKIDLEVETFLPKSEYQKLFWRARIYISIYLIVIGLSIYFKTILPVLFIGLPTLVGSWLMPVYGNTQHAGLAENVTDHRLNCRTVYMHRIHRFLYWNMNYHVEHHMFPLVPYHALPKLHELIKDDCPPAYKSILDAWREIIPAIKKQAKDPGYFVERKLPETSKGKIPQPSHIFVGNEEEFVDGWIPVCKTEAFNNNEIIRFNFRDQTYAIYKLSEDTFKATSGMCTHGNMHLSEGLIIDGQVECPKHNGRFLIDDGSVKRPPVCVGIKTYPIKVGGNTVFINIEQAGGAGTNNKKQWDFKVVSNKNVATYIKELVLEPLTEGFTFNAGEYLQFEIPNHEILFEEFDIQPPYKEDWVARAHFHHYAKNTIKSRRNYSMASNPKENDRVKFNVRIELPPDGINCSAGIGSSYIFNLKPGDEVTAYGPFGDFLINDEKELVYLGGGAGMAPLRSHISDLLENKESNQKISFWYGARSLKELFYDDYFNKLSRKHPNFSFEVVLSEPDESDDWKSYRGFVHESFEKEFLKTHPSPKKINFYLCGPPAMIKACLLLLDKYDIPKNQISYDEF